MNVPVIPAAEKVCFKCRYEAETAETKCPRCRRRLRTKTEVRVLGGVLVVLGAILVVAMALIIVFMVGAMSQSGKTTGARFTGTAADGLAIFAILGSVMLFGFTSIITGLWQLIFGRRNMVLVWLVLGLGVALMIGGRIFLVWKGN